MSGTVQWQYTINDDATTDDTLRAIIDFVNTYKYSPFAIDAVEIIKEHSNGDEEIFLQTLFNWACRNIDYKLDNFGTEVIATPDLSVRNGTADCKKYAILLGSILAAAGYTPMFKHVEYADDTSWTHIYVIVPHSDFNPDKRNTYTVLDPTNDCKYNDEVRYKTGELYKLNGKTMKVVAMGKKPTSGNALNTGDFASAGSQIIGIIESAAKNNAPDQLSYQRGSIRTLIRNNVHGLADAMLQAMGENPDALTHAWLSLGGDPNALKEDVLLGSAHKPLPVIENLSKNINHTPAPENRRMGIQGLNSRYSGVGITMPGGGSGIPGGGTTHTGSNPPIQGTFAIEGTSFSATISGTTITLPKKLGTISYPQYAGGPRKGGSLPTDPWVTDPMLLSEYITVWCGANGDGLGFNTTEITQRMTDLQNAGVPQGFSGVANLPANPIVNKGGNTTLCNVINYATTGLAVLGATQGIPPQLTSTLGGLGSNAAGCNAGGGGGGGTPPPPYTDPTNSGGQTPPPTGGSFGSIGGFFFKTMLVGVYANYIPGIKFLWVHGLNVIWAPATIIITSYLIFKKWKKQLAH